MFDFVHNNKRLAQIVLAVVFLPFAFWGVQSYFDSTRTQDIVAKVGGHDITGQAFNEALSRRQDQLRRQLGNNVSTAQLDTPLLRASVLNGLVEEQLLTDRALRERIVIPDRVLQQLIASEPAFQENGKFSQDRYVQLLQAQGLTPVAFEASVRSELMLQRLDDAYRVTALIPDSVEDRLVHLVAQQRQTSVATLTPDQYLSGVKLAPDAVKNYYDAHQDAFQLPEQVKLDYVVLSSDKVLEDTTVTPEEARKVYEQDSQKYAQQGEQRRASHILITVDSQGGDAAKQAARAKAESLLAQVRANPALFADLAKKNSQDPGSAVKGGDLGWFPRGSMVKPFDDKVFSMKQGEISDLVETPYGYHIIQLTGIKERGFDEVESEIEADLKKSKASDKFAALADQLNNAAFAQNDSIKPAADALHLPIQHSGWVTRTTSADKVLDSTKLRHAVFSDEVLKDKQNTETIDVGNNTLVVARITDYQPAHAQPLSEVSDAIEKKLLLEQAGLLAVQEGKDVLAKLQHNESVPDLHWSPPRPVSRNNLQGLPPALANELFKTDISVLPAYAGVVSPNGGYAILKVTGISEDETALSDNNRNQLRKQLYQLAGQQQADTVVDAIKERTSIKIIETQLNKQSSQDGGTISQ